MGDAAEMDQCRAQSAEVLVTLPETWGSSCRLGASAEASEQTDRSHLGGRVGVPAAGWRPVGCEARRPCLGRGRW